MTLFSTHPTLVPLVNKITRQVDHTDFSENGTFERSPIKPTLNYFRAQNERSRSTAHIIPYMQIMVLYRISRHTPHYSQYNQMASF